MSRLGKMPVQIPSGVTVEMNGRVVTVKGIKGEMKFEHRPEIEVLVKDGQVVFSIKEETKNATAYWGTTRSIISNMIQGVSEGFEKRLEMVGVGYRAKQDGQNIILTVGFSHPVPVIAPEGIKLEAGENNTIIVRGFDKSLVGLTAAKIKKIRKPEPYKGKGIKYAGEVVRRKAGKAAKSAK